MSIPEEGARATVSDSAGLLPTAFTVEFWFQFDGARYDPNDDTTLIPHRIVAARSAGGGVWYAAIDLANRSFTCALYEPGPPGESLAARHSLPSPGTFHHIACELGEQGIGIWYDGVFSDWQEGSGGQPLEFVHDGSPVVLGQGDGASPGDTELQGTFAGVLDEVRFSSGSLYDPHLDSQGSSDGPETFTPETRASVLDSTTALFHFDECGGSTALDSGPDARTAALENGATWVSRPGEAP